jgi:signal transduction histidine kinase
MYLVRAASFVERGRAKALLGIDVPAPYRVDVPRDRWWRPHVARFTDPASWLGFAYHLVMLPVGIASFVATTVMWSVGLAWLFLPAYDWALPERTNTWIQGSWRHIDAPGELAVVSVLGLLVVLAAPWVVRVLATMNGWLVRGLLGPSPLTARVHELTESRTAAVDLAAADRRQIERDLHDGVQQRLVSLAMDLGRAKEKMETDPERASELVSEAHEEAKRALTDVRNLARGIYPAILTDRGLDPALSALAARSPVPVELHVDLIRRPPASVEAAAYFVVSEALANVAKHARASRAQVTVRLRDDRLTVQVQDDGVGGADPAGSGLSGLRDRVQTLDGELHLLSPEGGPTVLMVELPCAS